MKKLFAILLVFVSLFVLAGCGEKEPDPEQEKDIFAKSEGVMTHAEFVAADAKAPVVIETFIQAKQGWWEKTGVGGVASFYTMDKEGGYFIYNMPCSEADYNNKLKIGTKIKVTGSKAIYSGLNEIAEGATFEIEDGTYIAEAKALSTDEFNTNAERYQNQFFSLKGLEVVEFGENEEGEKVAFGYGWNGAKERGDDAYFKVKVGETVYSFLVESYLCGVDTDVYKAVEGLQIGDTIDVEGFMYWYNGAQPHVTKITVNK